MISIRADLSKLDKAIDHRLDSLKDHLHAAMQDVQTDIVGKVKEHKLSGQVLNVRTGRLRRSINGRVVDEGDAIGAEVGTNVAYGIAHELGMRKAAAKAGLNASKAAFRAGLNASKASMAAGMAPRAFLRPTLNEQAPSIVSRIGEAVTDAFKS